MGDCGSRPNTKELRDHMIEVNTINDAAFYCFPYVDDTLNKEETFNILKSKLRFYVRKYSDYTKLASVTREGEPALPQLSIEVQKGFGFDTQTSCINRGHPFVRVSVEPNGPTFETFVADPFKPEWYRLIQVKQANFACTSIIFTVVLEKKLAGKTECGIIRVPFKTLEGQMALQGWYPVEGYGENGPRLKLRMQYIHNLKHLYERLRDQCQEAVDSLEKKLSEMTTV